MGKDILRDYQKEKIKMILKSFEMNNSVLLQMPTGTGKTIVISEIVNIFLQGKAKTKNILVLAHRRELIKQIKETINKNLPKDFIQDFLDPEYGHLSTVRVITVQSQIKKLEDKFLKNIALIVIDEAHHTPADIYKRILEKCLLNSTKLLGVTATPARLDGKPLKDYYKKLIVSPGIKWFIDEYLSHIKHLASRVINRDDLKDLKDNHGTEYDVEKIEKFYLDPEKKLIADLVESYKAHAKGKKCIVYAATQKHAQEICKKFKEDEILAEFIISGGMSLKERDSIVENFRINKFKVLVNVEIFTEGFDSPDTEVVQLARPTKSLTKYLQMVGRVTRKHEKKEYGLILDNACLWQDHGLATAERQWSLEGVPISHSHFALKPNSSTKGESKLPGNMIEIKEIDLVTIDDTLEDDILEIPKPILPDKLTDISVAHVLKRHRKTTGDFIDFFDTYLPDWNSRINYRGRNLASKKITNEMFELIHRFW